MTVKPKAAPKFVYPVSLGCSKNRVDTEAMLGILYSHGYQVTKDLGRAQLVIVNTCGFLQESVNEALSEISSLARLKAKTGFRLVVTGCLVQRMGRELKRRIPEIDAMVGVHGYKDLLSAVRGRKDFSLSNTAGLYSAGFYHDRILTTGPGWAYLRIADGCDNRCTYCMIPKLRGKFRSRPKAEIIGEASSLVRRGVKEINLIAQDTTNYGLDLYGERKLSELLSMLDKVQGLEWIRLLYTHPAHYDQNLIRVLEQSPKVVRYLDIPLQHSQDRMLKAMNRRVDHDKTASLISELRKRLPGLAVRTTFMTGFPGETKNDYDGLLDFVSLQRFERLGAFAFSAEPGTKAFEYPGQLAPGIRRERLETLMALQKKISHSCHRARVGKTYRVLVEGKVERGAGAPYRKGYGFYGRSYAEAPEVDGKIYIRSKRGLKPGEFADVLIDRAWNYDLGGTTIT